MGLLNDFDVSKAKRKYDDIINTESYLVIGNKPIKKPLVSVIMPIYNHSTYFSLSLKSVVNQVCSFDYEIIILDNNHPDHQRQNQIVVESVDSSNLRYYINLDNIGGLGSCNKGVYLAEGEYITFCHDDDLLTPNALQILVDNLYSTESRDSLIIGRYNTINENGIITGGGNDKGGRHSLSLYGFFEGNCTNGCGALFKRRYFIEIGGYNNDYIPCADYALNVVYTYLYGAHMTKEKTFLYRESQSSDTANCYEDLTRADKIVRDLMIPYISYIPKSYLRYLSSVKSEVSSYYRHLKWNGIKCNKASIILYYRLHLYIYKMWVLLLYRINLIK